MKSILPNLMGEKDVVGTLFDEAEMMPLLKKAYF
jgi:hypothetical protein